MIELLLIRHGETDHNKEMRFTGFTDIPLNSTGREQAMKLKEKFMSEGITSIYSSDLKRASETADIISGGGSLAVTPALREMNFGIFEALKYEELLRVHCDEISQWKSDRRNYVIPEGESFLQMAGRVLSFTEKIITSNDGGKAAVVSHSGCIRTILSFYLLGGIEDTWKFFIDNCTITRLCIDKKYSYMKSLNEK